ncbi:Pentatricopeptide repeat-containing protein [Nymphaea thermarum]|nr:Pentatricopeptide repeat-containing protein [Nymphaea thermarum]
MENTKELLREMDSNGIVPDGFTYNIPFDGHSRCGNLDAPMELLEGTVKKGIQISAYTCNILVNGLCKAGKMTEAQKRFCKAGKKMTKAQNVLKRLMQKVVRAEKVFAEMTQRLDARRCDIHLFERCFKILEEMKAKGLKLNAVTYGSLINYLNKHGKLSEAEIMLR